MKIGISTSVIQRGKTGIAQYLFSLLKAFDRTPGEQEFVLFTLEEDRPFFSGLNDRFTIAPVPEKFRPAIRNIVWHQTLLPKLAAEYRLDVLHVPSYRRLLFSAPCPRVATIHDLAPFRVAKKYDWARMFYGRVVVKQMARAQDRIIAVSETTARDLEQFFEIPLRDIRVIHNGLDHERFHPRDSSEAQSFSRTRFSLEKPFILYIARLEHPGKNHVRLIEGFEEFKRRTRSDWQLALGGSDWQGAEVIHERIAASPFKSEIRALGFVRDEDLPNLYSAASLFIYPSLYEGFGMPPVEAMACACPVVCSDRGALGEVVDRAARIVNPEASGSIAEAITELQNNPAERRKLVELGLKRAGEFSWERTAKETLQLYREACNARRASCPRNIAAVKLA